MKHYYILKIDSYEGEESSLAASAGGEDAMYVALLVDGASAEIVDWGYPSPEELLKAWADVTFENASEFV